VCQLVFLVTPACQCNEDAQVVCSSNNTDVGTGELGAELVEASRGDALLRAVDVKGGDRRVVGGLFGQVGKLHALIAGDAAGTARGGRVRRMFQLRLCIFNIPRTLCV
jgi:hypothetical protein